MKKKIIMLGMTLIVGMNFVLGCNKNANLPEGSKETVNTSLDTQTIADETIPVEQEVVNIENNKWSQAFLDSIGQDGYIINKSNTEELTYDDVYGMGDSLLEYVLGEIYARHGFVFDLPEQQKYFEAKSWYKPIKDNSSITLTPVEKYNVDLLKFLKDNGLQNYGYQNERVNEQDVYESNKEISLDLNGDGRNEVITYKLSQQDEYLSKGMLCVNDNAVEIEGLLNTEFAIVDVDPEDPYKEILISSSGFSSDYTTDYYIFKDNKIAKIGTTEGIFSEGIKLNGDGTFTARTRTDFLHTWHYAKKYYLDENYHIAEILHELYEDNTPVFLQEPFEFYTEKDVSSDKFMVSKGETVTIVSGDINEWVKIKTKSGEVGWFRVTDNSQSEESILEGGKRTQDVFAGLFYAD